MEVFGKWVNVSVILIARAAKGVNVVAIRKEAESLKVSPECMKMIFDKCKMSGCTVLRHDEHSQFAAITFPDGCDVDCRQRLIKQYKFILQEV